MSKKAATETERLMRRTASAMKWKNKMLAEGRCVQCGVPSRARRCPECAAKHAEYMRAYKAGVRRRAKNT